MKNLIDTSARYLATILISAVSVAAADADDINDKVKKYSAKAANSPGIVHYGQIPAGNFQVSSQLKSSLKDDSASL